MTDGQFLTVEEAATRLGVSPATVKRRCASGLIDAERVGRSWLIDAQRLPPPSPRAPRRLPASASGLANLHLALRHLRTQDLVRDLWVPDILRYEDDLAHPDLLLELAAAKLDRREPLDPPVNVPVPKSPFFLRNAINLSLADRLAYHGAVGTFARQIGTLMPANVYSARLSTEGRQFLQPGTQLWVHWSEAVQAKTAEIDGYVVETDITAFFDCISHTILMQELQELGVPKMIMDPLRDMLRTWSSTPNTGIPQGPDASRLLANFYLLPVDEVMLANPNISYFRYMDDIRIISARKHDAVEGLKVLGAECRKRNLSLSTKKTTLRHGEDAIASMRDAKIDSAKYAYELKGNSARKRRELCTLFRSSLSRNGGLNSRRAKFSIYRLRALREEGGLKLALKELENLAPLGWLVPAYLLPWLRRRSVANAIVAYLNDPERNTSDYLSSWLLAAFLDEPNAISKELLGYVRRIALDRTHTSYHRALALNVLALGGTPLDLASIRDVIGKEYDPEVVRGAVVALRRVTKLDRATADKALRVAGIETTLDYLRGRNNLPSLISGGERIPLGTRPR